MTSHIILWIIVFIVCSAVEAGTVTLVSGWFVGGAIAALITAACGGPFWMQIAFFAGTSALLLLSLRPLVKKFMNKDNIATNVYENIGKTALVTEKIDNIHGTGAVKLGSLTWKAKSLDESVIEPNALVKIDKIVGVTVVVEKIGGKNHA